MAQPKANDRPHTAPHCPVCQHPQTKVQRLLSDTVRGATMHVCARVGQCSVGMNLKKMDNWVAV